MSEIALRFIIAQQSQILSFLCPIKSPIKKMFKQHDFSAISQYLKTVPKKSDRIASRQFTKMSDFLF